MGFFFYNGSTITVSTTVEEQAFRPELRCQTNGLQSVRENPKIGLVDHNILHLPSIVIAISDTKT